MADRTLNQQANQRVSVGITSPSSMDSRDDGYVNLRIEDSASGECLVDVEIPAGRWWRLCQGGHQEWPAVVSPHLERVGMELECVTIPIPAPLPDDTPKETRRDVWKAVQEQKPDWLDFQEFSTRRTRDGHEATLRRWKKKDDDR